MSKQAEFNVNKMLKMIEIDLLLKRMYNDLGSDNRALEVVFNSEILGDSVMESIYQNIRESGSNVKNV